MTSGACIPDQPSPSPRIENLTTRVREALLGLLADHHKTRGIGSDAYHAALVFHPMAEGRFLAAIAASARTGLITPTQFQAMAAASAKRLAKRATPFGEGLGWGLEFGYRGLGGREPYLITTAMVAEGLIELSDLLPDVSLLTELREQVLDGMAGWFRDASVFNADLGIPLPVYSPNLRRPIVNAAAYCLGTLLSGRPQDPSADQWRSALACVAKGRLPGIGWPYEPDSSIVDLLHQCYILNALGMGLPAELWNSPQADLAAVETVSLFWDPSGSLDVAVLHEHPELPPRNPGTLRRIGNSFVTMKPKPARLWSLGELLVTLSSRIADHSDSSAARWRYYAQPVCEAVLSRLASDTTEAHFPRHQMHAALGLARYMEAVRSNAVGQPLPNQEG